MKVTLVADSTFIFEHAGLRILTDPWIGTTIYGGAWKQFPPPVISASDVGRLDYIFISHIHEDHCDSQTIEHLDRNATVLLMDRRPDFVERFLLKNKYRFREIKKIPAFQKTQLTPDLAVETIDADPDHVLNHMLDSSLLLHWDGQTIYFANDNLPYPAALPHMQKYDYALAILPAAGGSGYPARFDSLSADDKAREKTRIGYQYLDNFVDTIKELKPRRFMMAAGNHMIVGRSAAVNKDMTFLASPMTAYRYAKEKLSAELRGECVPLDLREGESWDADDTSSIHVAKVWEKAADEGDWQERKRKFMDDNSKHDYAHDAVAVPPDLDWKKLFLEAGANLINTAKKAKNEFDSHLYVKLPTLPNPSYGHVDGKNRTVDVVDGGSKLIEPYLEVSSDPTLMYQMLNGDFSWNIADAAAYLHYRRIPNIYDQEAFISLNYLRKPGAVLATDAE